MFDMCRAIAYYCSMQAEGRFIHIAAGILLLTFLASAGLGGLTGAQEPSTPDLAFLSYPQAGEADVKPVPTVLKRVAQFRMRLTKAQARDFLKELFDDHVAPLDYITAALNLGEDVSQAQREELVARETAKNHSPDELKNLRETIMDLQVQKNQLEGFGDYAAGLYRFSVLDLNRDGRPDLILIPAMYFGPSAGLKFYGRDRGKLACLGEESGDIRRINESPGRTTFRFVVNIIDPKETGVILSFGFDHRTQTWTVSKQYFAAQTVIPQRFQIAKTAKLQKETELRTDPTTDDGLANPARDADVTATLKGNIVARYPENSACYIYAIRGEWAFVAFLPGSQPAASSLHHDLDNLLEQAREQDGYSPIKPFLCGWVRKDALTGFGNGYFGTIPRETKLP